MSARNYVLRREGTLRSIGVTDPQLVEVQAVAKPASPSLPYVVVNELVCSALARAICLPTPPGFTGELDKVVHYTSLNFNKSGQALPPIIPPAFVKKHEDLSVGILMFDIWVMNWDRHVMNLHEHVATGEIEIFDHSHALFNNAEPWAIFEVLNSLNLGSHCLAEEIVNMDTVSMWNERIQEVPEFYIRNILSESVRVGLPANCVGVACDFLLQRRDILLELIQKDFQTNFPRAQYPPFC